MKLLILSDIHGDESSYLKILNENPDYDYIIIAGDIGLSRVHFQKPNVFFVKGNTDYMNDLPNTIIIELFNKKFLITHGHLFNVKRDLSELEKFANLNEADYVIFGHTHQVYHAVLNGVTYLNPGSVYDNQSYMLIEDGDIKLCKLKSK